MLYTGIDYHKKYSVVSAMDATGTRVREARIDQNEPAAFAACFKGLPESSRVVVEPCWNWGQAVRSSNPSVSLPKLVSWRTSNGLTPSDTTHTWGHTMVRRAKEMRSGPVIFAPGFGNTLARRQPFPLVRPRPRPNFP